ncbi:MAG: tetratricopeptide repeat protein [Candidatus Buchananbacteria bacterium]|nr:tetratricopeptide repeat protein [Candidatus Buchananbacteria bacterium]
MNLLKNKFVIIGLIFVALVVILYFSGWQKKDDQSPNNDKVTLESVLDFKIVRTDLTSELQDRYKNEIELAKKVILDSPDKFNFNALMSIGMIKYTVSDYDGARDAWLYVSQVRPQNSPAYYNLGNLYADIYKDCANAEKYFKMAIENDPNEISYLRNVFDLYNTKCPDKSKAEEILKKALTIKADNVDFMVLSAEFYRDQGNKAEATKFYEAAIKLAPQNQALKDEYNRFKSGL